MPLAHAERQAPKASPAKKPFVRNYGMAGCGLGSQVVGKKGSQVFAATTNGTLWSQSFGITAGTSNCEDAETEAFAKRLDNFIIVNEAALASDIARGNGETIATLAKIAGCSDQAKLANALQKSYGQIFPNADSAMDITDSIISVLQSDDALKAACSQVAASRA